VTRAFPVLSVLFLSALGAGACSEDPVYLEPMAGVEINLPDMSTALSMSQITIPIRQETLDETMGREAMAMDLGLDPAQMPTARRDFVDLSVEWTIKNLDDRPGVAFISVNGANEYFTYEPSVFVIDPEEDEEPPALVGGSPVEVPALGVVSGVFREDELDEAMMDLDALSRAGIAPEAAMLNQWPTTDVTGGTGPLTEIPGEAIPALLRLDVSFEGNTHMVLEYVVRVRDHEGRLVPDDPDAAIVEPSGSVYAPPAL
jgi:hypothetical protein